MGIIINNNDVHATSDPVDITFDYQLIYNVTKYLSWRINQSYNIENGELAKGRDFGSKGELDAALYISNIMTNLTLYDPDLDPDCDKSYHQQIKDMQEVIKILNKNITIHTQTTHLIYSTKTSYSII